MHLNLPETIFTLSLWKKLFSTKLVGDHWLEQPEGHKLYSQLSQTSFCIPHLNDCLFFFFFVNGLKEVPYDQIKARG